MSFRHLLTALGLNAIPAIGWYTEQWSAGTALIVYWFENLIGTGLMAIRIILHRRVRPSRGHFQYSGVQPAQITTTSKFGGGPRTTVVRTTPSFLNNYLVPMLAFTIFHGIFIAVIFGLMMKNKFGVESHPNLQHVLVGVISGIIFMAGDLLIDLPRLRSMPFRVVERISEVSFSRTFVIQLTIMGGMVGLAMTNTDRAFFGVFIFLKTMFNWSLYVPQYKPEKPPAWLAGLMDRIGSDKNKGGTFTEYWIEEDRKEAVRQRRNEEAYELAGVK